MQCVCLPAEALSCVRVDGLLFCAPFRRDAGKQAFGLYFTRTDTACEQAPSAEGIRKEHAIYGLLAEA